VWCVVDAWCQGVWLWVRVRVWCQGREEQRATDRQPPPPGAAALCSSTLPQHSCPEGITRLILTGRLRRSCTSVYDSSGVSLNSSSVAACWFALFVGGGDSDSSNGSQLMHAPHFLPACCWSHERSIVKFCRIQNVITSHPLGHTGSHLHGAHEHLQGLGVKVALEHSGALLSV
jgi:hypothetical protein